MKYTHPYSLLTYDRYAFEYIAYCELFTGRERYAFCFPCLVLRRKERQGMNDAVMHQGLHTVALDPTKTNTNQPSDEYSSL